MKRLFLSWVIGLALLLAPAVAAAQTAFVVLNNSSPSSSSTHVLTINSNSCASGVAQGMYMDFSGRSVSSVTDNSSGGPNTWTPTQVGLQGARMYLFTAPITHTLAAAGTITLNMSGPGTGRAIVYCDSGSTGSAVNGGTGASNTNVTTTTAAMTGANSQLWALIYINGGPSGATPDPPTGWTSGDTIASDTHTYFASPNLTSGQTKSITQTISPSGQWIIGYSASNFTAAASGSPKNCLLMKVC